MTSQTQLAAAFTQARPMLTRVAYAVLGSYTEAEDVVSDCWLRLADADAREKVNDVEGWAVVAVSRRALDVLKSARVRREAYVGPWLPEPVFDADADGDPLDRVTLDDTVSYALLVMLETLTPAERTAWVLHDLFGMEFSDVAAIVGRREEAVRQLATRARKHVAAGTPRVAVSAAEHRATTEAFALACSQGDVEALLEMLDPDVQLISDGGGQVIAAKRPVLGSARVARFLVGAQRTLGPGHFGQVRDVNGMAGVIILHEQRGPAAVISLTIDGGRITRVDIVRSPDKLRRFHRADR